MDSTQGCNDGNRRVPAKYVALNGKFVGPKTVVLVQNGDELMSGRTNAGVDRPSGATGVPLQPDDPHWHRGRGAEDSGRCGPAALGRVVDDDHLAVRFLHTETIASLRNCEPLYTGMTTEVSDRFMSLPLHSIKGAFFAVTIMPA